MPQQGEGRRRLRIIACRQVYSGTNQQGKPYTVFEVEAALPDGRHVDQKLRAFEALPIGQEADFEVSKFNSERHGVSYTLHRTTTRSSTEQLNEMREEMDQYKGMIAALTQRVEELELRVGELLRDDFRRAAEDEEIGAQVDTAVLDEKFGTEPTW